MARDRVGRLIEDTVARLREADSDQEAIESALRNYIDTGDRLNLSPYVLWDYFAISSPGLPEQAGYCGYDVERMNSLFERLMGEKFRRK
jgi:hypothetical protein